MTEKDTQHFNSDRTSRGGIEIYYGGEIIKPGDRNENIDSKLKGLVSEIVAGKKGFVFF